MRRPVLLALAVIVLASLYGWFDVRRRARIDRGAAHHRTDFTVYQAAAEALVRGTDPYEARNPRGYRYYYPPFLAVLLMPVAGVSPPTAALLFFFVSAAALAATLRALGRRAVLAGLLCAPFLHLAFERGQVTILLLALQVGALKAAVARRHAAAGLLLAFGTALRVTPLLTAVALGLGLLRSGGRPPVAYAGGFLAGVLLCLGVVPAVALGPARAKEVTVRWIERSRELFGAEPGELAEIDGITEYRFTNQSPRRVLATWTGWVRGDPFEHGRPALSPGAERGVDLAAYAIAAACGLLALRVGWARLHAPDPRAFALVLLLPLLMTRYTWPPHYVTALPALAFASRRARLAFALGVAAFFAALWRPLEPLGEAGPLLAGVALLAGGDRVPSEDVAASGKNVP